MLEATHPGALALACFVGSAAGSTIGPYFALVVSSWWTERLERRAERRAESKYRARLRQMARESCRRCSHPPEAHREDPYGCKALVPETNGDLLECECERFLARE